jgi:hypothetical protein
MKKGDEIDSMLGGGECLLCESENWKCESTDQQGGWTYYCEDCDFTIEVRTTNIITEIHIPPTEIKQWKLPTEHGID